MAVLFHHESPCAAVDHVSFTFSATSQDQLSQVRHAGRCRDDNDGDCGGGDHLGRLDYAMATRVTIRRAAHAACADMADASALPRRRLRQMTGRLSLAPGYRVRPAIAGSMLHPLRHTGVGDWWNLGAKCFHC